MKDRTGKKNIILEYAKRELWEKSQKYLTSPVKKILYSDTVPENIFSISGINALSHYSRLNPEPYGTVSIWDRKFAESSIPSNEIEGNYKIEIWRYPVFCLISLTIKLLTNSRCTCQ